MVQMNSENLDPVTGATSVPPAENLTNSPIGAEADNQEAASLEAEKGLGIPAETGMSPEEMKSNLKQRLAGVESAHKATNAKKIAGENNVEALRGDIIRSLFEVMKKSGVNLEDQSSVQEFLANLEAEDPDLYDMFDIAFNTIIGTPPVSQEGAQQAQMNDKGNITPPGQENPTMGSTEGIPGMPGMPADMPLTSKTPNDFQSLSGAMQRG